MQYDALSIVNEYNSFYEEAYYAWNPFYPLAETDLRFYLNDQWNNAEKQKLYQENRNQWVFNLVRKNINLMDGYQRAHRLTPVVLPQENKDQEGADELSDILIKVMTMANFSKIESDCFSGALKTGWNLLDIYLDYRDDPVCGDVKYARTPYSGFITDPYFTDISFSDCSYFIKRKYMSPQQAASMLPASMEKDVYQIYKTGWSRDDKFTWLTYQQIPNGQDFIAFDEFYKQMYKKEPCLVDTQTGQYMDWNGPKELLNYYLEKHPQLKLIKRTKRYIEKHILLNNIYMKTEINPFDVNEYLSVPYVAVFEPENPYYGLKLQSVTRVMIDPQRETNRRLSQMTDMIESSMNNGWIATADSVTNPESLFQTGQGRVIWKRKNTTPDDLIPIDPPQIPPSFFQLQEVFAKGVGDVAGINDAAFGIPQGGNESGLLTMMRQGASMVNMGFLFDNLRFSQKLAAEKTLKLIQTWTPEKIEKILGRKPTEQFYSRDFIKYSVSIQESVHTDTQRQMYFRQLIDLKQLTDAPSQGPITADMLIQAAPIQKGSDLLKQVKQNQQAQSQQAQQAQQVQMGLLQAQMDYQKAASIEKLTASVENQGRAIADAGLEDERVARAVDDRAEAALNRIKAAKELESMDDDKFVKYAQIIMQMEQHSKNQEDQIKQENKQSVALNSKSSNATNPSSQGS